MLSEVVVIEEYYNKRSRGTEKSESPGDSVAVIPRGLAPIRIIIMIIPLMPVVTLSLLAIYVDDRSRVSGRTRGGHKRGEPIYRANYFSACWLTLIRERVHSRV